MTTPHRFPVRIPEGWWLEAMPLSFGRGRLVVTNGRSVRDFW